jgi:cell division protein FtsB
MFILKFLKNKYFTVTAIFLVWIFFFAQYDIISQRKQRAEYNDMKTKIEYLEKEIEQLKNEKHLLKTDKATLEKYAREKYYMKATNEDVFVFDTVKNLTNGTTK